jgi:hypothetical protein
MLRISDRTFTQDELKSIRNGIGRCLDQGFSETEAVQYCRNFEEYNPELPEERALAKMKAVQTAVERRLGITIGNKS